MQKPTFIPALLLVVVFGSMGLSQTAHAQATHAQASATPQAQGADNKSNKVIKAELKQYLVRTEAGKEVLLAATEVKPGDLVEYRVIYTNQGSRAVRDVEAQLPIPAGLEYLPRSVTPRQGAQFSAGGAFAPEPLMREVSGGKKQAVPYDEYRRIRWALGQLAAGAKVEVAARARVSKGESQR